MRASVLAVLAFVSVAGGCDEGGARSPERHVVPFRATVDISESRYRPAHARILVGGSVTWINRDPDTTHTAETRPGDYTDLPGGERQDFDTHTLTWNEPYTVTFHKPATYAYHCSFHFDMEGTIDVVERRPPGPSGP
jgi:plastocyanin